MVGSRGSAPTGRFTYTTYRLLTGTLTINSISTKSHTSWLRNSFSWHAVADICCLRKKTLFSIIFTTSPLAKSWTRACHGNINDVGPKFVDQRSLVGFRQRRGSPSTLAAAPPATARATVLIMLLLKRLKLKVISPLFGTRCSLYAYSAQHGREQPVT